MATDKILTRTDGAVGWVVFNNPARHNAMSAEMWEGLRAALLGYEADEAVRVVVLTGAGGKAFVAGADISQFEKSRATPEDVDRYQAFMDGVADALYGCAKPTIAMVDGWCLGGGLAISLCCDLRLCSDVSRFGLPAARLGLGYDIAGLRRLVAVVGSAFAREITVTARQFDAAEAAAMGLVHKVVPKAALADETARYTEMIADNAPLTVSAMRTVIGELGKDPEARDMAACERAIAACFESQDYIEGRRAFMEKRRPAFTGR